MLLELRQIGKRYDGPTGGEGIDVLRDVSLRLDSGETLAIVGPSGSGKSTLLNIIGTLDRPTNGSVFLEGRDLTTLDESQLSLIRNQKIGFVFQSHHLLPQCSVLENVLVPTLAGGSAWAAESASARRGPSRAQPLPPPAANPMSESADQRARRLLDRVGLAHRLHHRPGQLSGGERQRVAVVRALINRPVLLLADEPTGSLDFASAGELADLLIELNRDEGVALIVVTHAPDLARRMNQMLTLRAGALVPGSGTTPESLTTEMQAGPA